jgi:hypothetical protein
VPEPFAGPILSAIAKSLSSKDFSGLPHTYPKGCPQNMGITGPGAAGPNLSVGGKSLSRKGFSRVPLSYPMGCPHNMGINRGHMI